MQWSEYSRLALRTESIPHIYYSTHPLQPEGERATRLLHAAMGLVTETAELEDHTDKVNLIEEIGDCFWYIPIIQEVVRVDLQPILMARLDMGTAANNLRECRRYAAELIDLIGKRHIFYGKELDTNKVVEVTKKYTYYLVRYCASMQVRLEDAWEANIKKLEKRYPDLRFNGEHAVNRNVSNELSHIEMNEELKSKDAAYTETAISLEDYVKANWEILKGGVRTKLQYDAPAEDVAIEVLRILGCKEEFARECLGKEFERCRFTIVHDGHEDNFLSAVPLQFNTFPVNQVDLPREGFNSLLRNELTPNQIERVAMGLAFELSQKFKKDGMDALATAMGDVYRTYSGRGDKLSDFSVVGMYELLGYPMTVEGILTVTHSILKEPRDASNNSRAG